jgi:hypothetical protein
MKVFGHLGLTIAVFLCVAMVMAPIAAAAGADQGLNQGNNQMQQGQAPGSGNTMNPQGNGQNNGGPGQGNGPQGMDRANLTGFGNSTLFAPGDGNMTAPPGKPDWDPANSTALNMTGGHGHRPGNMTGMNLTGFNMTGLNMTEIPPPGNWDPANTSAMNQTWYGDGNQTPPAPPQQNGADLSREMNQYQQQAQSQNNSGNSLINELIAWLKDHGIS